MRSLVNLARAINNHRNTGTAWTGHNADVKLLTVNCVPLVVVTVLLTGLKVRPAKDGVSV